LDNEKQTYLAVTKADAIWICLFMSFIFLLCFCVLNLYYISEVKREVLIEILDAKKDIDRLEDESIIQFGINKQLLRKGYYE